MCFWNQMVLPPGMGPVSWATTPDAQWAAWYDAVESGLGHTLAVTAREKTGKIDVNAGRSRHEIALLGRHIDGGCRRNICCVERDRLEIGRLDDLQSLSASR